MSPQAGCLLVKEIVPRLQAAIPRTVKMVGCADAQEIIQDSIAMAAKILHNTEQNGKKVTPGNVAYYSIQHAKSGRTSVGHSAADVHGIATQLNGSSRLVSFEEPVAFEESCNESLSLSEVFTTEADDPSVAAARNLDWAAFVSRQSPQGRAIIQCMDEGGTLKEVAKRFGVSTSAIHAHKKRIGVALLEFMGTDILQDVNRRPQWTENLNATSAKLACREQLR